MRRILRSVPRHPIAVLLAVAALTAAALSRLIDPGTGELRLAIDASVDPLLPASDEGRATYERMRRLFGNDEAVLVALVDEDVFSRESLARIQRLGRRFQEQPGVHHVVSIATVPEIRNRDGDLEIAPFYDEPPRDPARLAEIRRGVLGHPLYGSALAPENGRAALLLVYLHDLPERELLESAVHERISRIAEEEKGDAEVWVTSTFHVKAETSRILLSDLSRTVPLATLVVALVALLAYRSLRGVLVPLGTIAIGLVWTLGFVAAVEGSLNLVTAIVPPVVIVVGFAYAVHVVSEYYEVLQGGAEGPDGAVTEALGRVWLPLLLTGATTAAGFVSLMLTPIPAIRDFGAFSAVGVTATLVASLTFAPALLQLLPRPRRAADGAPGRADRLLGALADFDLRRRRAILWAAAAISLVSLVGMARIQVNADFVGDFPPDNPVRLGFERVNHQLGGASSVYVMLESRRDGAFEEPGALREIAALQRWLEEQPEVAGTTSLADYVAALDRGFRGAEASPDGIPDSQRLIAQLLFFASGDELEGLVDSPRRVTRVLARVSARDSAATDALIRRIEARLAGLPADLEARVTGGSVLVAQTLDAIALGQALSLSSALIIIFAILCLLFTSFRIGLLALLPNAVPVLAYFGVLGFSGIPLNPTTGLVACLVLGIAVDDTIHYLARFNVEARRLADEEEGARLALRLVGRPVTYTSVALCLGFLVLVASELRSQAQFGALAAGTLALAWLLDMTFTPALALRLRIVTLWDVLGLDLGERPERSIPLFEGMSATQARIVALLADVRRYPKGHSLMRSDEWGDEFFVVIDGELVASVATARGRLHLGTLGRGHVVGEVALFHGRRTADVEAKSDVRLLRLSEADLERVRRRYPRIGARLYRNLSRILAEHVASSTARAREAADPPPQGPERR